MSWGCDTFRMTKAIAFSICLFLVFKPTIWKSLLMLFLEQVNNSKWCGTLQKAKAKISKYLTRLQIFAAELKAMHSLPSLSLPPTQKGMLLYQISRRDIDRVEQRVGSLKKKKSPLYPSKKVSSWSLIRTGDLIETLWAVLRQSQGGNLQNHIQLTVEMEKEPSDKNCTNILNCHFSRLLTTICRGATACNLGPAARIWFTVLVMLQSKRISLLHCVVSLRLHGVKMIFFPQLLENHHSRE